MVIFRHRKPVSIWTRKSRAHLFFIVFQISYVVNISTVIFIWNNTDKYLLKFKWPFYTQGQFKRTYLLVPRLRRSDIPRWQMYRQRLWPRCKRYVESSVSNNDGYDRPETINKLVNRSDTHAESKEWNLKSGLLTPCLPFRSPARLRSSCLVLPLGVTPYSSVLRCSIWAISASIASLHCSDSGLLMASAAWRLSLASQTRRRG
jgi:hypothetical protein